jgi:uncharacterized protein YkwD
MPFSKEGGKSSTSLGKIVFFSVITVAILFIVAIVVANSQAQTPTVVQAPQIVQLNADVIFAKVNEQRVQNGLKPLIRDSRLDQSAQIKADDMFKNNYFEHANPTTGKQGYTYVFETAKSVCSYASENISMTLPNESGNFNTNTVTSWMNSKPHHDAILKADYTLTGVAINGDKIVQHFCIAN